MNTKWSAWGSFVKDILDPNHNSYCRHRFEYSILQLIFYI